MTVTEELRQLMTLDANTKTSDIELRFAQIASMLFERFAIEKNGSRYLFHEIEFYYYNQNHRDIITHPRVSEALHWYINDFGGIDLNFESSIETTTIIDAKKKSLKKYLLKEGASFGGILIRKLVKEDGREILDGPWACAELFRCFNALDEERDFPRLVENNNGKVGYFCEPRKNLRSKKQTDENKVNNILGVYDVHPDSKELCEEFNKFKDKCYKYVQKSDA